MNWPVFQRIVATIYGRADFSPYYGDYEKYSLDDYLNIFKCFFDTYKSATGQEHPPLRKARIKDIMERMPYAIYDGEIGGVEICAEAYPDIIAAYFNTPFLNCDYRINHFMCDTIRILRMRETGWI